MSLVNISEILEDARERHYGVGAFDVSDYRMAREIVAAAEELRAPVILMGLVADMPDEMFDIQAQTFCTIAERATVPVCVHLDHSSDFESCKRAISDGYTSVMLDASDCPLSENIRRTKEVVDYAHARGVTVEAELGHVGDGIIGASVESAHGASGHDSVMTDVNEMVRFIDETNVDCLAVSFGTSHGVYKCEPKLDLELLEKLNAASRVPLVVHGGSGTPNDQMKEAIKRGITKVNIYSDICKAMYSELKRFLNEQDNLSLWTVTGYKSMREAIKETAKQKMIMLGCQGVI